MNQKATIFDYARICNSYKQCEACPLGINTNGTEMSCSFVIREVTDKANEIILKWCEEHPIKTRQSEFLKMFPNAKINETHGVITCCPQKVDKTVFLRRKNCRTFT